MRVELADGPAEVVLEVDATADVDAELLCRFAGMPSFLYRHICEREFVGRFAYEGGGPGRARAGSSLGLGR